MDNLQSIHIVSSYNFLFFDVSMTSFLVLTLRFFTSMVENDDGPAYNPLRVVFDRSVLVVLFFILMVGDW